MVTLIASYLFDIPTHLIDIYNRKEDSTTQNWTLPYLPGPRLAKEPVFVLTSKQTFSGAEEFAFDLKNQKRATIVGEATGGGAHPVSGHQIADYFTIGVPFAKSLDPVTKTNWEEAGVEPDVKVSAEDALKVAEKLANETLYVAKKKLVPGRPRSSSVTSTGLNLRTFALPQDHMGDLDFPDDSEPASSMTAPPVSLFSPGHE